MAEALKLLKIFIPYSCSILNMAVGIEPKVGSIPQSLLNRKSRDTYPIHYPKHSTYKITSVRLATKQQERMIIDLLLYCLISVVYMLTKLSIVGSTV